MNTVILLVLNSAGNLLALAYVAAVINSRFQYFDIIKAADRGLFPVPPLLRPGFSAVNLFPGLTAFLSRLLVKKLRIKEFEAYCALAWSFAAGVPVTVLSCLASAVTATPELMFPGMAAAAILACFPLYTACDKKKQRIKELEAGMPGAISKTVLLCGAGLSVSEAWRQTAESGEGPVYEEMKKTYEQFRNGIPLGEAMQNFALGCGTKEAGQFAGIVSRSVEKGGTGIIGELRYLNSESWDAKKQRARLRAQAASAALMLPLLLMFAGIIAMVIIPLFEEISI